jgi:hypothetical protein
MTDFDDDSTLPVDPTPPVNPAPPASPWMQVYEPPAATPPAAGPPGLGDQPAAYPAQHSAPQYGGPPNSAPQYGAQPGSAPQYGAPQYGAQPGSAPQYGAPQYGAQPPYPGAAGSPAGYLYPPTGGPEAFPVVAPPRRRRTGRWIAAGVAALVVIAGGAVGAYAYSALSGGGPQPESVLPSTTIAFAKIDLDPAANQKIALYRLSHKFPSTSGLIPSENDLKDSVLTKVLSNASIGLNYERDIKPWLGDRAAAAAVPDPSNHDPDSSGVDAVIVLAYRDETKMRAALSQFQAANPDTSIGYVTSDGFVLISDSQAHAETVAAATKTAPLTKNTIFQADVKSLHGDQVAEAWIDVAAASKLDSSLSSTGSFGVAGRLVMGVHADDSYLELDGSLRGGPTKTAATAATKVTSLPADTVAAIEVTGIGDQLAKAWASVPEDARQSIEPFIESDDLKLPSDLTAVFGTDLLLSVGSSSGADDPPVALQTATADPGRAQTVISSLIDQFSGDENLPTVKVTTTATGYVMSTDPAYTSALLGSSGARLGSTSEFQRAVPNAAGASEIGFLNYSVLQDAAWADVTPQDKAAAANLAAVGFSVNPSDDGTTFDVRAVTK